MEKLTDKLSHTNLLSPKECALIVRRTLQLPEDENLQLLEYWIEPGSSELIGFMGDYYKLYVRVKQKQEHNLQYFIKSLPLNNAPHRDECERKGFFRKERAIYGEILPKIQKYASGKLCAKSYYTRSDLMVLEDLSYTYRQIRADESYTLQHLKVVLAQQAELHAASIAWEQAEGFSIGERYKDVLFELHITTSNEWYMAGVKGIIYLAKRHEKFQTSLAQDFISNKLYGLLCKAEEIAGPSKTLRNVLCHRDTWDRNIFFKFAKDSSIPDTCCFVDFQLTTYSPPTLDVLFMLYIIPTAGMRRQIYDACLEHYFQCLQSQFARLQIAADTMSRQDFLEHCKIARVAALILWALCEPLLKMPEGLSKKFRTEEPDRFDFYLNSDRSGLLERVMELHPEYKSAVMAPIGELLEYLMETEDLFKL
ncbi:uncharacterized protein LOC115630503 [Scaptodrosophila lebanonensis]|uniref:Uncharacterized protein LOC115630503 n=1 Tax=Drosophila lebanonensis TaxID=7225 RepID=A0A6J2U4U7_DROLE|nr:uncharacterized protein LOC115630503 [Scaptodrosophila lebanonensis]